MFLPVLTQDAINALKIATHDADPSVAKAAQQVIELHQCDVELSQDAIDILNTETERTPFAERTPFIEKIGDKRSI
jgi:hypothetical protein